MVAHTLLIARLAHLIDHSNIAVQDNAELRDAVALNLDVDLQGVLLMLEGELIDHRLRTKLCQSQELEFG